MELKQVKKEAKQTYKGGKALYAAGKAIATGSTGGMFGAAYGIVSFIKECIDADSEKQLQATQKREACPHITMIVGGLSDAHLYVQSNGGLLWNLGKLDQQNLRPEWFSHKDLTFKPLLAGTLVFVNNDGKSTHCTISEYLSLLPSLGTGCGCVECNKVFQKKHR